MSALAIGDFARFFEAVHGTKPFPWQERLAEQVCSQGGWPAALDIPTGAGKTAAIDIAVFHLAFDASRTTTPRRASTRIAFVVDRRLVVDDAFNRAQRIQASLRTATDGILERVASALKSLAERDEPLAVARLRGGMVREPDWVRSPAQAVVLVSTVDQVGSRLLFRGYGVSDGMRPIHAGLLGMDTLVLLDEAHLSQPFLQTARQLFHRDGESFAVRPSVVTLSATQLETDSFRLNDDDAQTEMLARRLRALKPTELPRPLKAPVDSVPHLDAFADHAIRLSTLGGGEGRVVAVVVNRVKRARAIMERLEKRRLDADAKLLIGRTRPLDREALLRDVLPFMRARDRAAVSRPLFVVATQCIEAGADLDFDALVSEIAPLDCLRQRFGRLNRLGRESKAQAVIVACAEQVASRAEDRIYGASLAATWRLLNEEATEVGKGRAKRIEIDFGITASNEWLPDREALAELVAPRSDAPILLPPHVDAWSKTSPPPAIDPEPALFLHGPASGPPEVGIVWRADLLEEHEREWLDCVSACPPSTLETISVPLWEARKWLTRGAAGDIADTEADKGEDEESGHANRRALKWRGLEGSEVVTSGRVLPGDVIVVPATYGGCDAFGWAPQSDAAVIDRGTEAARVHRGMDVVRVLPPDEPADEARVRALRSFLSDSGDCSRAELLQGLATLELPAAWRTFLDVHGARRTVTIHRFQSSSVVLALSARRTESMGANPEATTESDETSLRSARRVLLDEHSRGVEAVARRFVEQLRLPESIKADVTLAAFLHDAGKAHPLFKEYLYGGDELAAIAGPALAKSGVAALRRGGLPRGARHEAASVRFALRHPRFGDAHDPELVLWLIGTHHGHGRPFFPAVTWPARDETFEANLGDGVVRSAGGPQVEDPGEGWPDRFRQLKQRYGVWELAWLEAIVRLADHRRSEAEQEVDDE